MDMSSLLLPKKEKTREAWWCEMEIIFFSHTKFN